MSTAPQQTTANGQLYVKMTDCNLRSVWTAKTGKSLMENETVRGTKCNSLIPCQNRHCWKMCRKTGLQTPGPVIKKASTLMIFLCFGPAYQVNEWSSCKHYRVKMADAGQSVVLQTCNPVLKMICWPVQIPLNDFQNHGYTHTYFVVLWWPTWPRTC